MLGLEPTHPPPWGPQGGGQRDTVLRSILWSKSYFRRNNTGNPPSRPSEFPECLFFKQLVGKLCALQVRDSGKGGIRVRNLCQRSKIHTRALRYLEKNLKKENNRNYGKIERKNKEKNLLHFVSIWQHFFKLTRIPLTFWQGFFLNPFTGFWNKMTFFKKYFLNIFGIYKTTLLHETPHQCPKFLVIFFSQEGGSWVGGFSDRLGPGEKSPPPVRAMDQTFCHNSGRDG